jgi:hypothetical protein
MKQIVKYKLEQDKLHPEVGICYPKKGFQLLDITCEYDEVAAKYIPSIERSYDYIAYVIEDNMEYKPSSPLTCKIYKLEERKQFPDWFNPDDIIKTIYHPLNKNIVAFVLKDNTCEHWQKHQPIDSSIRTVG